MAPYEIVIADYSNLDRLDRLYLENFIDEAFTGQEIEELSTYFKETHRSDLITEELLTPIHNGSLGAPDFSAALGSQQLYMFSHEEGYDLLFEVYGRFDLSQHAPLDEDQEQVCRLGVLYGL